MVRMVSANTGLALIRIVENIGIEASLVWLATSYHQPNPTIRAACVAKTHHHKADEYAQRHQRDGEDIREGFELRALEEGALWRAHCVKDDCENRK